MTAQRPRCDHSLHDADREVVTHDANIGEALLSINLAAGDARRTISTAESRAPRAAAIAALSSAHPEPTPGPGFETERTPRSSGVGENGMPKCGNSAAYV